MGSYFLFLGLKLTTMLLVQIYLQIDLQEMSWQHFTSWFNLVFCTRSLWNVANSAPLIQSVEKKKHCTISIILKLIILECSIILYRALCGLIIFYLKNKQSYWGNAVTNRNKGLRMSQSSTRDWPVGRMVFSTSGPFFDSKETFPNKLW